MSLRRGRDPHEYKPEEFDAIASALKNNERIRADIETITGVSLRGKTPRELFDLWRQAQRITEVKLDFARLGAADVALNEQARLLREQTSRDEEITQQKQENESLKAELRSTRAALEDEQRRTLALTAAPAAAISSAATR